MRVIGTGTITSSVCFGEDLKSHLRLFDDADESIVTAYILAATDYIWKYVGLPIFHSECEVYNCATSTAIELPRIVDSVITIEYLAANDVLTYIEFTDTYAVRNLGTFQAVVSNDLVFGKEYKLSCYVNPAYGEQSIIKQCIYLLVGEMYENREDKPEKYAMKVNRLLDMVSVFI